MNYREHTFVSTGIAAGAAAGISSAIEIAPITLAYIAFAGIGGVAPDLDHPKAYGSKVLHRVLAAVAILSAAGWYYTRQSAFIYSLATATGVFLFIWSIRKFSGHRGITHSIFIPAVIVVAGIIAHVVTSNLTVALMVYFFALGWAGHIIADMTTPSGVPVFTPITKKRRYFHVLKRPALSGWALKAAAFSGFFFLVESARGIV